MTIKMQTTDVAHWLNEELGRDIGNVSMAWLLVNHRDPNCYELTSGGTPTVGHDDYKAMIGVLQKLGFKWYIDYQFSTRNRIEGTVSITCYLTNMGIEKAQIILDRLTQKYREEVK